MSNKYIVNAGSIVSGEYGFHLTKGDEFPNYLPDFDYDYHVKHKVLAIVERENQEQNSESVQGQTAQRNVNKTGSRRKR